MVGAPRRGFTDAVTGATGVVTGAMGKVARQVMNTAVETAVSQVTGRERGPRAGQAPAGGGEADG